MADTLSPVQRSSRMSSVKQKNTHPELVFRHLIHKLGFRYRLHSPNLPGRPDIVFPKYKTVIFVHGCFWHRHANCKLSTNPKTRIDFWQNKFSANIKRDAKNIADLQNSGWRVFVVWQCELSKSLAAGTAERFSKLLRS